jgi:hypothetical protein
MNKVDWSKVKFRASSWGNLLTEPRTKADKEAGILGVTCQKELIKIYNLLKYGRKKDITTAAMEKGKLVEPDSIRLFSLVEGKLFWKNEDPLENEWFTGHPDIFAGSDTIHDAEEVHDIKSSWEMDSFTPKLIEELDAGYEAQLNVYYSLTGAQGGALVYCLVSAPPNILESEKKKLLYSMDVATEYSPEYLEAAAELEKLMVFDDIDYRERCIKITVPRNDDLIEKMKAKVPIFRQWLADFEKKHMSQYPKDEFVLV